MQIFAKNKKPHHNGDQTLACVLLGEPMEEARVMSSGWLEEFWSCFKFCYAVFALKCRFKGKKKKKKTMTKQNTPVLSSLASGPPVEVPSSP